MKYFGLFAVLFFILPLSSAAHGLSREEKIQKLTKYLHELQAQRAEQENDIKNSHEGMAYFESKLHCDQEYYHAVRERSAAKNRVARNGTPSLFRGNEGTSVLQQDVKDIKNVAQELHEGEEALAVTKLHITNVEARLQELGATAPIRDCSDCQSARVKEGSHLVKGSPAADRPVTEGPGETPEQDTAK